MSNMFINFRILIYLKDLYIRFFECFPIKSLKSILYLKKGSNLLEHGIYLDPLEQQILIIWLKFNNKEKYGKRNFEE